MRLNLINQNPVLMAYVAFILLALLLPALDAFNPAIVRMWRS